MVTLSGKSQHIGCNTVGKADDVFTSGREVMVENGILTEAFAEDIGIRTAAAVQRIVACTADQGVVAVFSIQSVITRSAIEDIIAMIGI